MPVWSDKELIDAPVELLGEKDIARQRKLQEKRAQKMAKQQEKEGKAKEKATHRLINAFRGKKSKDPFGELDITSSNNF